ncbi:hypothetical protein [Peribacillus butanolivorans]|uniref:hypothetical protein n=1 Tax=Peribacillus butanolivorans TaxID=421767 RepID=UPI0035D7E903
MWLQYCTNVTVFGNGADNVVNEFVYVNEPDVPYQGLGYSSKIFINHNEVQNCGRAAVLIGCAADEFKVLYNYVEDATIETTGTRSAINCSTGAKHGRVMHNKIRGTKHKYGIEITASCVNVQTFNNDTIGAVTKPQLNSSTGGGFEGYFMHSTNGNRYIVTVNDAGAPVYTAGK